MDLAVNAHESLGCTGLDHDTDRTRKAVVAARVGSRSAIARSARFPHLRRLCSCLGLLQTALKQDVVSLDQGMKPVMKDSRCQFVYHLEEAYGTPVGERACRFLLVQ